MGVDPSSLLLAKTIATCPIINLNQDKRKLSKIILKPSRLLVGDKDSDGELWTALLEKE